MLLTEKVNLLVALLSDKKKNDGNTLHIPKAVKQLSYSELGSCLKKTSLRDLKQTKIA